MFTTVLTDNLFASFRDKLISKAQRYYNILKDSDASKLLKKGIDLVGISFDSLLKKVLAFDETLTNAAKQLGLSKDGIRALAGSFENASINASNINKNAVETLNTIKAQLEAQQQINDSLGTAGLVTTQARIDQTTLTKQMGLQAGEAANLYKLGQLNLKSADDVARSTAAQVANLTNERGIRLNLKTVLQDVAKIEGQLAAQYQNNPELIAEAVVQMKELGLETSQVVGMTDKLLDFQGSIRAELEAELLTGKALNLERARELALRGDSAAAAKELMDNVGGLSEFQNLNVLQQRSLASAVGLTADQLANSLKQQQLLEGSAFATQKAFEEAIAAAQTKEEKDRLIAEINQASNADQLMAQYQQISLQQKFNSSVEKLQEVFANMITGPVGSFIDGIANMLSSMETIKTLTYTIGTIMAVSWGASIAKSIGGLITMATELGIITSLSATTSGLLTFGVGIAAALIAAGGIYSMVNKLTGVNATPSAPSGGGGIQSSQLNSSRQEKNERPIVLDINNKFDVGNKELINFSSKQNIASPSSYEN